MISDKLKIFIQKSDEKLNKLAGWEENELNRRIQMLLVFKSVECGWRQSCGSTDRTQKIHREWLKVVKKLRLDGVEITEDKQKHQNAYATNKGGFWHSIIYSLEGLTHESN